MSRTRRSSALPLDRAGSRASRLDLILSSEPRVTAAEHSRTSSDPLAFIRVMAEIERLRGLRVHPESTTRH